MDFLLAVLVAFALGRLSNYKRKKKFWEISRAVGEKHLGMNMGPINKVIKATLEEI